jgi:membrane-associated phospholipid phosphatase
MERFLNTPLDGSPLRKYSVPVVALVLAIGIFFTDSNQVLFLFFNKLGPSTGDTLWANWTVLGDGLVVMVLALPFVGRQPSLVWAMVLTALIAGIVVSLLKQYFGLPRPPAVLASDLIHVIGPAYKSRSFPSGHTAAAFAFAGVMSLYIRSFWVLALTLGLAIGVGISRMAVGVHWPLDVAVGAGLGWLCAVGGRYLAGRWCWGETLTGQRVIAVALIVVAFVLLMFFKADSPRAELLPKGIAVAVLILSAPGLGRFWRRRT